MRKYLIATHGTFASGIRTSIELIIGEQPDLDVLCAYTTEDFDLPSEIKTRLDRLEAGDELVVMTDAMGGSVNNAFMNCMDDPRVHVLTGLNLVLAIELLSAPETQDTESVIASAVQAAKDGVIYCNQLEKKEEEEF